MVWQPLRHCDLCDQAYAYADQSWRCRCGGTLSISSTGTSPHIELGEGRTPVIRLAHSSGEIYAKLEFMSPTGSFKDRGAATMLARLRQIGIRRVVDDSAGNAGVSIAAYAAAAGIGCRIYVARTANLSRVVPIRCYGADVIIDSDDRNAATAAALADTAYYAGHAWDPFFIEGLTAIADEIVDQMPEHLPTRVFFPLGQGTLMLGLVKGFTALVDSGRLRAMPQLIAVQSDACAPLAVMVRDGLDVLPSLPRSPKVIADGIGVAAPVRWRSLRDTIRRGAVTVVTAHDATLAAAVQQLGKMGLVVEPTSAVVFDAMQRLDAATPPAPDTRTLLLLTASGLKTPMALERMVAADA